VLKFSSRFLKTTAYGVKFLASQVFWVFDWGYRKGKKFEMITTDIRGGHDLATHLEFLIFFELMTPCVRTIKFHHKSDGCFSI